MVQQLPIQWQRLNGFSGTCPLCHLACLPAHLAAALLVPFLMGQLTVQPLLDKATGRSCTGKWLMAHCPALGHHFADFGERKALWTIMLAFIERGA